MHLDDDTFDHILGDFGARLVVSLAFVARMNAVHDALCMVGFAIQHWVPLFVLADDFISKHLILSVTYERLMRHS